MQPHEKTRPGAGAGIQQAGETSKLSLPPALHEQVDWEGQWHYAAGYADGYAAAERAIAEEITQAIGVKPYDRGDVLKWLIRNIGQPAPRRLEPYSSPENGTDLGVAERQLFGQVGRAA